MINTMMKVKPSSLNVQLWNQLTQSQKEVVVDLIIRSMYADNHVALAESYRLRELSEKLIWEAVLSFDGYVRASISNASREKNDPTRREKFFNALRMRLDNSVSRRVAYDLCCAFMKIDGTQHSRESSFLNDLKNELEIVG